MHNSRLIFLADEGDACQVVGVTYEKSASIDGGKVYERDAKAPETLMKTFDTTLKVGDYVVVPTTTRHGMTVCQVSSLDNEIDLESDKEILWIICKFDPSNLETLKAQEAELITLVRTGERRRKRAQLKEDFLGGADEVEVKALEIFSKK